jgi:hypothetical protein
MVLPTMSASLFFREVLVETLQDMHRQRFGEMIIYAGISYGDTMHVCIKSLDT